MIQINRNKVERARNNLAHSRKEIKRLQNEKFGVANYRGGLVVLYRICNECLTHKYHVQGMGQKCTFCDESKPYRVVLFDIHPRQDGYK